MHSDLLARVKIPNQGWLLATVASTAATAATTVSSAATATSAIASTATAATGWTIGVSASLSGRSIAEIATAFATFLFGRFIASRAVGELILDPQFLQGASSAESDAVVIVDIDHQNLHRIANFADAVDIGDVAVGQFADMD